MKNNFKYELMRTGQKISVAIVYEMISKTSNKSVFLITEELLEEENVPVKKMVRFLEGSLKETDQHYSSCNKIFVYNSPIEKNCLNSNIEKGDLVSKIITSQGEINISDNINKN